jgi:hypothetical protein
MLLLVKSRNKHFIFVNPMWPCNRMRSYDIFKDRRRSDAIRTVIKISLPFFR